MCPANMWPNCASPHSPPQRLLFSHGLTLDQSAGERTFTGLKIIIVSFSEDRYLKFFFLFRLSTGPNEIVIPCSVFCITSLFPKTIELQSHSEKPKLIAFKLP